MSDLVGNPEDRFSQNEAQIVFGVVPLREYRKVPKFSDTKKFAVNYLKSKQRGQILGKFVKKMQIE